MLRLAYRHTDQRAVLSWDETDVSGPWLSLLRDMAGRASEDARAEGGTAVTLPWWSFVGVRSQFGELLQAFGLRTGQQLQIDAKAADLLRHSARNAQSYVDAVGGNQVEEAELLKRLRAAGFTRQLKTHQIRNGSSGFSVENVVDWMVQAAG